MADLPEIETLRRELDREVSGKKIKSVDVLDNGTVKRTGAANLKTRLEGVKIVHAARTGLILTLEIDEGEMIALDLGAGAALRRHANKDEVEKGTAVVITFTQTGQLRMTKADDAEMFITTPEALLESHPKLTELGSDLINEPLSWPNFARKLMAQTSTLRQLLTDDRFIVGLGDLYSDEILHSALLRYDRTPASLSSQEVRRLYRAIVEVLHDAVKHRGTTIENRPFVDLHGEPGGYGDSLSVYGRAGERSANGRGTVQRKKVGGSWTYYAENQV